MAYSVIAGDTALEVYGQGFDSLPEEVVALMTSTSGITSIGRPYSYMNVMWLAERTDTYLRFIYNQNADFAATSSSKGHKWEGIFTPNAPPRELVLNLP